MKSFLTVSIVITSFLREHVQCQCSDRGSPYTSFQRYGMIQSPGYPDSYGAYENCDWTLNPPQNIRGSELILLNVQLETHVAEHADGSSCYGVEDYVMLGKVKGCDKEGPVCLAFMLNSVSDFGCHHILREHFPHCHSMIHDTWPFKVSFHTENSFEMKGFQLNYTFIDCNNFQSPPPVFTPMTPRLTTTIPTTTTPFVEDVITQRNETASNASILLQRLTTQGLPKNMNQTSTSTSTITSRSTSTLPSNHKDTYSTTRTSSAPVRSTSTLVKSTTTFPAAPIDDNPQETTKTTNSMLIGIFIALCLIFALLVLIFIFRRRIKACIEQSRCTSEPRSAPTNNNTVKKVDDYMVDLDKERIYEAPTTPRPCSKPSNGVPSISSNLIGENNSNNFQYNHLEHFRYSVASEDGCQNPAYTFLER